MTIEDWTHLERLVMALQAKLGAGTAVRHGEVVTGRKSKTDRKIDVSVRGKLGTSSILVAIDCAFLNKNVDVLKVGIANAQFDDVGANHGIIVTTKGYAPGAVELASAHGIETCIMRPATEADLAGRVQDVDVEVRWEQITIKKYLIALEDGTTCDASPDSGTLIQLTDGRRVDLHAHILAKASRYNGSLGPDTPPIDMGIRSALLVSEDSLRAIHGIGIEMNKNVQDTVRKVRLQPGDWVFERVLPNGIESEPTFFRFAELDDVAMADQLCREVCTTTSCPEHGKPAKSVRSVWSYDNAGRRQARFQIDPCCEKQDFAVMAALEAACERMAEAQRRRNLDATVAFLMQAEPSKT